MGIPGMIIGVPVFAVIFYILRNVLDYILKRKRLPRDTKSYVSAEKLDINTNTLVYRQEKEAEKKPGKQKRQKKENKQSKQ